jgi:hypothetical protein
LGLGIDKQNLRCKEGGIRNGHEALLKDFCVSRSEFGESNAEIFKIQRHTGKYP